MKNKQYYILFVLISTTHFVSSFSKSSLTFVIDDTGSMSDDIDQVLKESNAIFDTVLQHNTSQIENFVIVTFNDPGTSLRVNTKSRELFKTTLRNIDVDGGGDCPEMSMSGIKLGLENSLYGSDLYVFTDASAKDYHHMGDEVISLAQNKQCRVVFVLTGECDGRESPDHIVYYTIAKSTSGEVFHLDKGDVNKVLNYVKENIKARRNPILTKELPPGEHTVPVVIDSGHSDVIFSVSGRDPDIRIKKDGREIKATDIMTTKESKIVKPKTLSPGPYTTDVKSYSNSTLVVTGVSDFDFQHGFSTFIPKNIESTSKQPIPEQTSFMTIVSSEGSPDLISAEIIDNDDSNIVIITIPLHKNDKDINLYVTDPFIPPNEVFKIGVNGIDRKTKSPIRRIGATPIVPQKPSLVKPKIDKADTTINAVEGSDVEIPCRIIEGYKPNISWTFKAENSDETSLFAITDNIVKLPDIHISQAGWYECVAKTSVGQDSHKVKLHVEKYPEFIEDRNREIEVAYSSSIVLSCKVSADPPPIINWKDEKRIKLFGITSSGDNKDEFVSKLTLRSIRKDSIYFCNAENRHGLIEDKTIVRVKRHFNIVQRIPPVKPIKIYTEDYLQCLVDSEPPATVTWYHIDTEISSRNKYNIQLSADRTKITFKNMTQVNVGEYKCEISNAFEKTDFTSKVTLNVPPSILKEMTVLYKKERSTLTMKCNVERGEPTPTISWYFKAFAKKDFINLRDHVVKITDIKKEDGGKYKCVASNIAGVDEYYVDLVIEYPPEIREVTNPITTKEGDRVVLSCKYSGYPPPKVYWNKGGRSLSGGKYRIHLDNSLGFVADVTDTGVYTCVAENALGVARNYVEVSVKVPPTIEVPDKTTLKVVEGESIVMPCVSHGTPRPNEVWTHRSEDASKPSMKIEKNTRTGAGIIRKAVLDHAGYYTCVASNSEGNYVLTYTVIVNAKARIVSDKTPYYYPVSGDVAINIPCKPYGSPKPEVLWTKDGVNIPAGTKWYDIDSDGTLTVKNVDEETNGEYTCNVENYLGRDNYKLIVKVYPYPIDALSNKTIAVEKGKDIKLPCDIPYTKADSLRWFKNGQEISRSELSFTNVEESKSGVYFCRVSNGIGSRSAVVNLKVGYPPRFISTEYTKSFPLSEGFAMFNCEVDDADSKVIWYRKDETISDINFIYFLELKTGDNAVIGDYQCKVSNEFGTISRDFNVKGQECTININDSKYQPLILTPDSNWFNIKMKNNTINIPSNFEFKIVCPSNADNENTFENFYGKKEITVKCDYDQYLLVPGEEYPNTFSDFLCIKPLVSMTKRTGTSCSAANTELIKIGYQTPSKFLDVYKVCYDKDKNVPVYTESKISPTDVMVKPIGFDLVKDRSLNFDPEELYNCKMQKKEISSVLGVWFHADDKCCFDKKLLVNPAFMPYGPAQVAAYNYFNVAPSWSTCKGMNNSVELENRLRIMVNELNSDVNLWSGTHENLRLSDNIKITDRSGNGVQVPLYFWKVIQDPSTERSIAIVHVNVPDLTKADAISFVRCTDICRRVPWLRSYTSWLDTTIGFTYCCSIDDFERGFGYPKDMFHAAGPILG